MAERAYDLQPHEIQTHAQLLQEQQRNLVQYAECTLEMKRLEAAIPACAEKQRVMIASVIARHGIRDFIGARIEGPHLYCRLPDDPHAQPEPMTVKSAMTAKPNGPLPAHKE